MNIFGWRKNITISEEHPTFKVRYLGNVQTVVMKGDGCTDRSTNVIWNNFVRNGYNGVDMKVELTGAGMKAYTKEQGLTEYLAHRISYCVAHPDFPKLFVWVYRHEGRKMKIELRCHAVLCRSAAKAKTIAIQLREKLAFALTDFKREKLHKQNSRLVLQRTNSLPKSGSLLPLRTQLLSTAKNFRPAMSKSQSALKLDAIQEDVEEFEEEEEEQEEEEEGCYPVNRHNRSHSTDAGNGGGTACPSSPSMTGSLPTRYVHKGLGRHDILDALDLDGGEGYDADLFGTDHLIDLEFGNDMEELGRDADVRYCLSEDVDSDEESAESGFHDQDNGFPDSDIAEGFESDKSKESGQPQGSQAVVEKGDEEKDSVCTYPFSDRDRASPSVLSVISENTAL